MCAQDRNGGAWWRIGRCQHCRRFFSRRRRPASAMCSPECVEMFYFHKEHPEMKQVSEAMVRFLVLHDESYRIDCEWFLISEVEGFGKPND